MISTLFVGTMKDLRTEENASKCLTYNEGKKLQSKIKADYFIECSALTQENLKELFEKAVSIACNLEKKKSRTCKIL